MSTGDEDRPPPDWATCARAPGCIGIPVGSTDGCFAHLGDDERDRFLGGLVPGADIDMRGTALTRILVDQLFDAVRNTDIGRPHVGHANFDRVLFADDIVIERTAFGHGASFRGATFTHPVRLTANAFTGPALFDDAAFDHDVEMSGDTFGGDVTFRDARFGGQAPFSDVDFSGNVQLAGAVFHATATFNGRFRGKVRFGPIRTIPQRRSRIHGRCSFLRRDLRTWRGIRGHKATRHCRNRHP